MFDMEQALAQDSAQRRVPMALADETLTGYAAGLRPQDWRARPVAPAALTPQELAAKVDATLERCDRVLFTATPREELDTAERWQRLADEAWCGQLRHVVASTARLSRSDRDFAGEELALALNVSPTTGKVLVWHFGELAALPGLVEAVEVGRITRRHAEALLGALNEVSLSLEQRQAITLIALARYTDQIPGEWARIVRRLILTVDPQAAQRRKAEKTAERRVEFYPQPDGQGGMWLTAPAEQLAAAQARVQAEAAKLKAAGDERTTDQLLCDLTLALLTHGTLDGAPVADYSVQVIVPLSTLEGGELEVAELPGWGPILPSTARDLATQASTFTQVTVEDQHGHVLTVSDPLSPEQIRRQAATQPVEPKTEQAAEQATPATAEQAAEPTNEQATPATEQETEQETGGGKPHPSPEADRFLTQAAQAMRQPPVTRELTGAGYKPGSRLTRHLEARDRTCVFPGCGVRAQKTDKDHRIPWPLGPTNLENLQSLCRHHHRAKQALFTVQREPDGTITWTSRGGWIFRRTPKGY